MPARQYLLQALPIALQALNLFSEAEREGYVTLTRSAHATVVRVQIGSIHPIADKERSRKPSFRSWVFSETHIHPLGCLCVRSGAMRQLVTRLLPRLIRPVGSK